MSQYRKPDQLIEELEDDIRAYKTMATDKLNTLEKQNMILFLKNKRLRSALEELLDKHTAMLDYDIDLFIQEALGESDEIHGQ